MEGQKINGQWRGYFNGKGDIVLKGEEDTEFVLEIEINGTEVTGYSYSYFQNRKYYVICSLSGTYYKSTKSMKVSETARIKGLTPPDWADCLQTHILSYEKKGGVEELNGRWVSAAGQLSDCGLGTTTLTRKTVSKDLASYKKPVPSTIVINKRPAEKKSTPLDKNKASVIPPLVKASPKTTEKKKLPKNYSDSLVIKKETLPREIPDFILPESQKVQVTIVPTLRGFEKRASQIIKTISIENSIFTVDLYDNGEVDGDSVSLFYNSKLLLSHKRLTEKPIRMTLEVNPENETSDLTMYAENLGSIPPNSALMVVTYGDKRFEVNITSSEQTNGTVRFKLKE
jgi:hypothetical protein